ncbi:Chemotaxis regulator - transmits chemoreceptor signals to flagelllar motor components CheY [Myxococcus hansupus]|uniref:Chemotaxis regulator-transmits chemoreceptor signals to flagelllar motor components CheY n=1 Tax=Pseudomyxococcus hansupus TaxID=1297742 RepID=A0A0H4WKQ7_9BACT|nr:response regulator [Myxococcus hansupus]AKQ63951.1 Chemotaxis regulator - transmits chemoreceptor signals to flagelllar motor components CheY [Myxococcus hansupus]MBL0696213.1 response regulator [Comamonas sp. JC664]GHG65931.1 response regulator [Comamonas sp. KCTC 72670]
MSTHSTNVLLVDDSPTVRNIVKIYLMNLKVSTVEADDAARGLQILRLVPVSLVIADINMPGMDGITFVKEVRASAMPQVRSVPILLLTAEKNVDLRQRGTEAGANAFIQKPVSHHELTETVRQFLTKA